MVYHFKVYKEKDGYWANGVEIEGCRTQGETLDELKANLQEVLDLYLDEPANSSVVFALPDKTIEGEDIIEIRASADVVFPMMLRRYRQERDLTQWEMAKKMGMKNVFSYQRLERRSNPKLKTLSRVKSIFPDLSLDSLL